MTCRKYPLHYRYSVHLGFRALFTSDLQGPPPSILAQTRVALYWGWPVGLLEREAKSQGEERTWQLATQWHRSSQNEHGTGRKRESAGTWNS